MSQANNPTHGVTLEMMLKELVAAYGWPSLGQRIAIRCFTHDPSIKSSLTFLRRTPWARQKVEELYVRFKRGDAAARPPVKLFAKPKR
ncbi:VF530 family protein [Crenobacter luteus]|uniref:Transporter n=1 Tax=Crenobacter luteus TaxID=1452487 RepID=A0A163CHY0_9NEIS|nr:VF530 family protein [Crenobacter luteus]KZE32476.1 transporter [Crenobacter luteus]